MIGLDIAKSVFQVHGEDAGGRAVAQRRLRRSQVVACFKKLPPARIGIEACGSAHYWGRELQALGHEVRLIPAAYVKPFVRRNKTDARDAAAICTALGRPDMRFVAVKSATQQAARALERSRDLLVRQHTQLMNSVRSQLAEFGIIAAQGRRGFAELAAVVADDSAAVPALLLEVLRLLVQQVARLAAAIALLERRLVAAARSDPAMRRLTTIPGVGPLTAHAVVTAIGEGGQFASARDFAAWCGLTRRVDQSADKRRERGISRQGDNGVRKLLVLGASALLRQLRVSPERATAWQRGIFARRPVKVAVVAQAAKNARTAWAMLRSGESYRRRPAQPVSSSNRTAAAAAA
jgi:transposase